MIEITKKSGPGEETLSHNVAVKSDGVKEFFNNLTATFAATQRPLPEAEDACPRCESTEVSDLTQTDDAHDEIYCYLACRECGYSWE